MLVVLAWLGCWAGQVLMVPMCRSEPSQLRFAGDCSNTGLYRDSRAEGSDLPGSVQHVMTCLSGLYCTCAKLVGC